MLTVLFADLVGFTESSDGADPEDVRARVRPFHSLVRQETARTGGTVARVVGDAVMVVWGYPLAREDDPRRAVRTALAIRAAVRGTGGEFHVRIGINTGEAVVAFSSGDERADDAMGDAVNVAARLASAAPVDGLVIGTSTAALVGDDLVATALGPLVLKGKAEPVPAWLVDGLGSSTGSAPSDRAHLFIGRASEVAELTAAFAGVVDRGGVERVLVIGEPGIGKSRLLAELRRSLAGQSPTWLVGRCRPDTRTPGLALAEIIKATAEIADDDAAEQVASRLATVIPVDVSDRDWLIDRAGPLVGLESGAPGSPEEIATAWARLLAVVVAGRPAVVVLEDIHWADDELLRFLGGPAIASISSPILMIATARPEPLRDQLDLRSMDRVIRLAGLTGDDSDALVGASTSVPMSALERAELVARAGGNPLFLGELVRLMDQMANKGAAGRAKGIGRLPDTVQMVIAARLDLLERDARAAARDAAVVGARFWRGAVAELAALDPGRTLGIDAALDRLVSAELIRPSRTSSLPGDVEFAFRHALVREVAYGQLTRGDRAFRHASVGAWLGRVRGADRGDLAGVIADHDLEALALAGASVSTEMDVVAVREHARQFLVLAGEHAQHVDPSAAGDWLSAAANLTDTPVDRLALLLRATEPLGSAGRQADVLRLVDDGLLIASDRNDVATVARLWIRGAYAARALGKADWTSGIARAVATLESDEAGAATVEAYEAMTFVEMTTGSGRACIDWADRAVELAERIGHPVPLMALDRRGYSRAMLGDAGGLDDLDRVIEIAEATNQSAVLANALSEQIGAHLYLGEFDASEEFARRCIKASHERGMATNECQGLTNLGFMLQVKGRWAESVDVLAAAAEISTTLQDVIRPAFIAAQRIHVAHEAENDALFAELVGSFEREILDPISSANTVFAPARCLIAGRAGNEAALRAAFGQMYLQTTDDIEPTESYAYIGLARASIDLTPDLIVRLTESVAELCPYGRAVRSTLDGIVAAWRGKHQRALDRRQIAVELWTAFGSPPQRLHALRELGESLLALGRPDDAARVLHESQEIASRLGLARATATCERLLTGIGEGRSPGPDR
jgi:class 3 adenylate cyclase/tetratricopeptide (TPR) repeat protein